MRKLFKKINILIVSMLLTYIFLGTTFTVSATEIINEDEIINNKPTEIEELNDTPVLEQEKDANYEEKDSKMSEEEFEKSETEVDSTQNTENNIKELEPEEDKNISENSGVDEVYEKEIVEELKEDSVPNKEATKAETEEKQSPPSETAQGETLEEAVSKGIDEEGYIYSLQKNRDLAIQIMQEDLAQKDKPRLFSARVYVPSHVTAFIEKFAPLAVKYANQKGLYPSVMLAQAALESGWGSSSLSKEPFHQLFGIKGTNFSGSTIKLPTQEWVSDQSHPNGGYMTTILADFRVYNSYEDAFKDQSEFLMKSRYTNVRRENAPTYQHATQALSSAGYATDPDYAAKLNNIIQNYDLNIYDTIPTISYSSHVQSNGWLPKVNNGQTSGTTGEAKRMEALKISIENYDDLGINYSTHVQSKGWTEWTSEGNVSGTTGEGKQIEAIKIKLTGIQADYFDVFYRVHVEGKGWLNWTKNGLPSGTAGYGNRVEAISIMVKPKGYKDPASNSLEAYYEKPETITYDTHVQTYGWQKTVYNGKTSGTTGEKKRMEAIIINLNNAIYNGGIQYKSHVQRDGWQDWVNQGELSGTEGQYKRLEAIQIKLTGEIAKVYDIYYRTHIEDYGWLGWTKNGLSSGSEGLAKRVEAIQIKLVKKGSPAPGGTSNSFVKK